jgi:hypothetical protein
VRAPAQLRGANARGGGSLRCSTMASGVRARARSDGGGPAAGSPAGLGGGLVTSASVVVVAGEALEAGGSLSVGLRRGRGRRSRARPGQRASLACASHTTLGHLAHKASHIPFIESLGARAHAARAAPHTAGPAFIEARVIALAIAASTI